MHILWILCKIFAIIITQQKNSELLEEQLYVGNNKSTKKNVLMEVALVAKVLQQYHSNPMGGHIG